MKWSDEQINQLRALAQAGTPNGEIAQQLGISIDYVYAKRSQLGITMEKVRKAATVNPEFEAAVVEMENSIPKDCKSCHYWVCCCVGTDNKVKGCKHHVTAIAREHDQLYIAKAEFLSRISDKMPCDNFREIRALLDSKIPDSWGLKNE